MEDEKKVSQSKNENTKAGLQEDKGRMAESDTKEVPKKTLAQSSGVPKKEEKEKRRIVIETDGDYAKIIFAQVAGSIELTAILSQLANSLAQTQKIL